MGSMKAVKMFGLTDYPCKLIGKLPKGKLEVSERFHKLLIWQILIGIKVPLQSYENTCALPNADIRMRQWSWELLLYNNTPSLFFAHGGSAIRNL